MGQEAIVKSLVLNQMVDLPLGGCEKVGKGRKKDWVIGQHL